MAELTIGCFPFLREILKSILGKKKEIKKNSNLRSRNLCHDVAKLLEHITLSYAGIIFRSSTLSNFAHGWSGQIWCYSSFKLGGWSIIMTRHFCFVHSLIKCAKLYFNSKIWQNPEFCGQRRAVNVLPNSLALHCNLLDQLV